MQKTHGAVLAALIQVQSFLDENDGTLRQVNVTGARQTVDDVITTLSARASDQDMHRRMSSGARAKHLASRRVLLEQHIRAISGAARLAEGKTPALSGITAPPMKTPTPALLAAAEGNLRLAEQNQAVLTPILGEGFLEQLRAAMAEVQDATATGRTSRTKRAAATAAMLAEVERGKNAVRVLDGLVLRNLGGDVALEREWRARRKVVLSGRPPSSSAEADVSRGEEVATMDAAPVKVAA
jgi:hypothetical protein